MSSDGPPRLLYFDPVLERRAAVAEVLANAGFSLRVAAEQEEAAGMARRIVPDLLLVADAPGIAFLRTLDEPPPTLVLTDDDDEQIEAFGLGAQTLPTRCAGPVLLSKLRAQLEKKDDSSERIPLYIGTDADRLGTLFADRYRLEKQLGRGGAGVVYLATDEQSDAQVALKMQRDVGAPLTRERFEREVAALRQLDHPNLIRLLHAGVSDGTFFYAMDHLPGTTLRQQLSRNGALPVFRCLRITAALADALACVHAEGLLHRDLKPENVMFNAAGAPILTDFGLALRIDGDRRLTMQGVIGTPRYMAPEQLLDPMGLDARVDVYGLGALLYAMSTGQPPLRELVAGQLIARLRSPQPPLSPRSIKPDLPEALDAICQRATAYDREQRYGSAGELAAAASAAVENLLGDED